MSSSTPRVYLVLGTPGSGRRSIVRDLVENGLEPEEKALVLLAEGEAADPADRLLEGLANVTLARWRWEAPGFPSRDGNLPAYVFLIADPQAPVVDQLEALKPWMAVHGAELGRVYCVVDCTLAEKTPALRPWFDACIHFSDVVFLARREGVANKWLSDFRNHFRDQCFPCHFVLPKKGDLENPALILDPTPRRVSQYFDDGEELPDVEIETDDDEDDTDEDEADGSPVEDPYLVRMRGGRRVKEVPDLSRHLAGGGQV